MSRRIPLAPVEGWLSVLLVLLLCLTMAWSIDDAAWVLGRATYTDFLAIVAVLGALAGVIGAKVGRGRWSTYVVGALAAALVVPVLVGDVLEPGSGWREQFEATAGSVVEAWRDLAVRERTVTAEYGHFLLVLGIFTWATAMYAAYATFGHRRPLGAIVLVGIVLVTNMAFTVRDQLFYLVVYSLAALFLLIRFHVLDEEEDWARRRIGDPTSIGAVYLRGGTVFIAFAVAGSLLLTQAASSAPLAGAWRGVGDTVVELSRDLQRYLPTGGSNRTFGVTFGSTATVSGVWTTDSSLAATIEVPRTETREFYWRAATYDRFDLTTWSRTDATELARDPGEALLEGTAEEVEEDGRREVVFAVYPEGFAGTSILSPQTPVRLDVPVRVEVVGSDGWFTAIAGPGADPYQVTAHVPLIGDADPAGLTENRLRVAGTDYPEEIEELYLDITRREETLGPDARELLATVLALAPDDNPYDIARTMELYLRSSGEFRYDTDVRDLRCEGLSTVECFARFRQGYCEYFATTMAVLLREAGIPTRMAQGFLPGPRELATGIERLYNSSAHAWVEVYFPGYGWVEFDPTGGGVAALEPLPSGRPEASARPTDAAGPGRTRPPESDEPRPSEPDEGTAGAPGGGAAGAAGAGPLVAVAILLMLAVGGLAVMAWQRGPRGPVTPDGAYGMLVGTARRFGFGPRPTQTVYEYAGSLGRILPASRAEIETVARAKVEVAYGRAVLSEDRVRVLREAQRRLRVGLLRLVLLRRRLRRGGGAGP